MSTAPPNLHEARARSAKAGAIVDFIWSDLDHRQRRAENLPDVLGGWSQAEWDEAARLSGQRVPSETTQRLVIRRIRDLVAHERLGHEVARSLFPCPVPECRGGKLVLLEGTAWETETDCGECIDGVRACGRCHAAPARETTIYGPTCEGCAEGLREGERDGEPHRTGGTNRDASAPLPPDLPPAA